jgi:hypothetical protein
VTERDSSLPEIPAAPKNRTHSGFLVFSFVLMLLLSIAALLPIYPNDFFPYLRIGDQIVKTGAIPTTEFMTYTRFGQPATYLYWFPSLIFLGLYKLGGATLIGVVCALCIASFYTFLWHSLRELNIKPLTCGFVLLITAVIGINYWAVRPQIFTYPLFGAALWVIMRWQNRNNRALWVLPLLALLWANLHASFIILFFLLIPALIFGKGDRKPLITATIAAFLATFINRYGWLIWTNMLSMVNNQSIRQFSVEWKPMANDGWQANIFFITLLLIPILTSLLKEKIPWLYWIWFLGFGWMALTAGRYGVWFLGIEVFLLAMLVQPLYNRFVKRGDRFQNKTMNLTLGVTLLIIPILLLPGIRGLWWTQSPPIYNDTTPIKAAEWLNQNPQLPGEVWTDFVFSTYLTYALPERRLFVTNRFEDIPPEQFIDNKHIADADFGWETILEKYQINLLMPSLKMQPDLVKAAGASPNWKEMYRDDQAVIFIHLLPVD